MKTVRIAIPLTTLAFLIAQQDLRAGILDDLIEGWNRARHVDSQAKRVYGPAEKALEGVGRALDGDLIASENEKINEVRRHVKALNRELGPTARRTRNDWMSWSGTNAFSIRETTAAVQKLQSEQERLLRIEANCGTLRTLVLALNVSDHMNIKGVARALTSLKPLDIEARKEAVDELDRCKGFAQQAITEVRAATEIVSTTRDHMIRNREKFKEMYGSPATVAKSDSSSRQSRPPTNTERSAATLDLWRRVAKSSTEREFTRPIHDPLAYETEYSPPPEPLYSGPVIVSAP